MQFFYMEIEADYKVSLGIAGRSSFETKQNRQNSLVQLAALFIAFNVISAFIIRKDLLIDV